MWSSHCAVYASTCSPRNKRVVWYKDEQGNDSDSCRTNAHYSSRSSWHISVRVWRISAVDIKSKAVSMLEHMQNRGSHIYTPTTRIACIKLKSRYIVVLIRSYTASMFRVSTYQMSTYSDVNSWCDLNCLEQRTRKYSSPKANASMPTLGEPCLLQLMPQGGVRGGLARCPEPTEASTLTLVRWQESTCHSVPSSTAH